ncbi:MAG: META domain-containing protein [Caldilineaceae bacterium]
MIISALIVLAACGRNRTPEPTPTVAPTEAPTVAPTATPVPPPTATPIPAPTLGDGGTWTLQSLNGASVPAPNLVTATFAENGLLTGISGCNNYSAGYSIDGDTIAIEPPATTRKACSDARMMLEEEYLAALTAAATFSVDGATLTLFDGDSGAEVATLLTGAACCRMIPPGTWSLSPARRHVAAVGTGPACLRHRALGLAARRDNRVASFLHRWNWVRPATVEKRWTDATSG